MPQQADSILPASTAPEVTAPATDVPRAHDNRPAHALADTLAGARYPEPFVPKLDTLRLQQLQPTDTCQPNDTVASAAVPPAWLSGVEGSRRQQSTASDSGLLTIITLIFVALALNFRHCPRIFANFSTELLSVRRRANVFDEHTTNETRVLLLILLEYVACLGILLYALVGLRCPPDTEHIFRTTALLMGLASAYYVFQLCAYSLVSYIFSTPDGRRQWLRGFNASQALAGIALLIPAILTIFYPDAIRPTLIVAGCIYFLARIIFIIKGFRIFFTRITSLVYFILYLCTLEIIPVIIVYRSALFLTLHSPQ